MKTWPFAVFGVACLAMAGCRAAPAVALLEQENRDLEMQIYELADMVEACRRENARLHARLERDRRDGEPAGVDAPRESPETLRELDVPGLEFPDAYDDVPSPDVEVPSAGMSGEEFLERFSGERSAHSPDELPAPPEVGALDQSPSPGPALAKQGSWPTTDDATPCRAESSEVAAITLDERLTGGYDADRRVGHEGIITVIEPRDADGRLVPAAAPVAVVVLDPALPGEAARVARWDLTAEEVAEQYRKTPLSEGIHLELVWPRSQPIHRRLHLFVRYVTDDGRNLEADRDIEIDVPLLEAQRPSRAPHAQSMREPAAPAAGAPAADWQRRRSPPTEHSSSDPPRTALAPAETRPRDAPSEPARPETRPSQRRPPVWSPDRP
jgi:hypothetical protein